MVGGACALSGTYEQLFTYVMFASILFSVAAGIALFRLRRTMPTRSSVPHVGLSGRPVVFIPGRGVRRNTLIERPANRSRGSASWRSDARIGMRDERCRMCNQRAVRTRVLLA